MTLENNQEKRRFHRIFYAADALLECAGTNYPCHVIDLSLKGCLLEFSEPWQDYSPETLYTLTLNLSDEISIIMNISVVHAVGNQIGFKCQHIDIDSISRLRRLVELNLGNSELLERELAALNDSAFRI